MKRQEPSAHLIGMDAPAGLAAVEAATLLSRVSERDEAAFTTLVASHDRDLLRVAYVITGSRPAAEDAAQATWERLWRRPPALRDPSRLRAWLLTVCANEARHAGRRRRRGAVLEAHAATDTVTMVELSPELADLRVAISRLSGGDRELLALRFAVSLTSAEIAEHLGLSAAGVRTRVHRLIHRLRSELGHD